MNTLFRIFLLFLSLGLVSFSATRGNVKIIEASENIRYLSQKIVKDYLLYYQYPQRREIKQKLKKELEELGENFRVIAVTSKDTDTKDVLEFLAYNKEQMEEIFNQKSNFETASLIIDYSETLLEGVDSIADGYKYEFSKEEKMLMAIKQIEYLLERIIKYYMVLHTGFNNTVNKELLNEAMLKFEEKLLLLENYHYPYALGVERAKIIKYWKENKKIIHKSETLFIPILLFSSIEYLEILVDKLALYHSKNQ